MPLIKIRSSSLVNSVDLRGTPTAATAAAGTASTQIASTGFVGTEIDNLVNAAPALLNTLDELAAAIGDDASFATTVTTSLAEKLPLAGGTMTGDLILGDNVRLEVGSLADGDLAIYHDTNHSQIEDRGTGNLYVKSNGAGVHIQGKAGEESIVAASDSSVSLYHDNSKKIETTANGVTVTGGAVGTMTTDNDGSFAMSASNNFKCTPTGNFTLTFTSIVAQSGNILLVNSGGHTVAAHANTKVDANLLATVSTAGTYLLSYFSDGTNVYMTNSAIYT